MIQAGNTLICWGCDDKWMNLPILNLPKDAIKVRRRMRPKAGAKAFVTTDKGITGYYLEQCDGGLKLSYIIGVNSRKL